MHFLKTNNYSIWYIKKKENLFILDYYKILFIISFSNLTILDIFYIIYVQFKQILYTYIIYNVLTLHLIK
jgi:hypothetical protein